MTIAVTVALVAALAGPGQVRPPAESVPAPLPSTVQACLELVSRLPAEAATAERAAGRRPDPDAIRTMVATTAGRCAAQFAPGTVAAADHVAFARLLAAAGRLDEALALLERRVETPGLAAVEGARALELAVDLALAAGLGDAGLRLAESFLPRLDAFGPVAVESQLAAYRRLLGPYRSADGSPASAEHAARRYLALFATLAPADRDAGRRFGRYLAYEILAKQRARAGDAAGAIALWRDAVALFSGEPADGRQLAVATEELGRLELVGRPAPALLAERWINGAPGGNRLEFAGRVTILEFSAHWCVPCKDTYPALQRLRDRFGPGGLQVVLVTRIYGFFGDDRAIPADEEFARVDRMIREELRLPFLTGVSMPASPSWPQGAGKTLNEQAYFVQPIPQILVIDREGIVRRVIAGLDDDEELRLAGLVGDLLRQP